jgi:hypothetical protein
MNQPCPRCAAYAEPQEIRSPGELESILETLRLAIERGNLQIDSGDLQWTDWIDCQMDCPTCGQKFELTCETYHGSGGRWQVLNREASEG